MYVYGFQSEEGPDVKVYTLELVSERHSDPDTDVEILEPKYLLLAIVTVRRQRNGLEYVRGTVTYDVKNGFELSTHTRLGLFTEKEAEAVHAWVRKHGKGLVKWMSRCPVAPKRGRTFSTDDEQR